MGATHYSKFHTDLNLKILKCHQELPIMGIPGAGTVARSLDALWSTWNLICPLWGASRAGDGRSFAAADETTCSTRTRLSVRLVDQVELSHCQHVLVHRTSIYILLKYIQLVNFTCLSKLKIFMQKQLSALADGIRCTWLIVLLSVFTSAYKKERLIITWL